MANKKTKEMYRYAAQHSGLFYDEKSCAIYGQANGFSVILYEPQSFAVMLHVAAKRAASMTKEEKQEIKSQMRGILDISTNGNVVQVKADGKFSAEKLGEMIDELVRTVTRTLDTMGYAACCEICETDGVMTPVNLEGSYTILCDDCFRELTQKVGLTNHQMRMKRENIVGGIVGALLGALVGVACIVLVSRLGYVAAISGLVMAVCTLKGYEMLGGRLTKKGVAVSVIVMLVMTYFADRLDWTIVIMQEFEEEFFAAYQSMPMLLDMGVITPESYWSNLALLYLFLLVGSVPIINSSFKKKNQNEIYRMEDQLQSI